MKQIDMLKAFRVYDCGVAIMGAEDQKFWHDHKGAKLNAIRTSRGIADADIVVVRFGEKFPFIHAL